MNLTKWKIKHLIKCIEIIKKGNSIGETYIFDFLSNNYSETIKNSVEYIYCTTMLELYIQSETDQQ